MKKPIKICMYRMADPALAQFTEKEFILMNRDSEEFSGKVTDQAYGHHIAGEVVELSGLDVTEKTDEQGNFLFADLESGSSYTLTVSVNEYNGFIELHKGKTVTENVGMVNLQ